MKDFAMIISTISLIGLVTTLTIISVNKRKKPPKQMPKIDKLSLIFGVVFILSLIAYYFIPQSSQKPIIGEPTKQEALSEETKAKMKEEIKESMANVDNEKIKTTLLNEIEHIKLMTAAINENQNDKMGLKVIIDKCAILSKEGEFRLSEMQNYINDETLKTSAQNIQTAYSYYKEAMIYAFRHADSPDKQNSDKYKELLEKVNSICKDTKSKLGK